MKTNKVKSLTELDEISRDLLGDLHWTKREYYWRASAEEQKYIKSLSPKDVLAYRQQRENEVFLDKI